MFSEKLKIKVVYKLLRICTQLKVIAIVALELLKSMSWGISGGSV